MSELRLPVAGRTQRDDVPEVVGVGLSRRRRLHERPDWNDVVDVRVPTEFLPTRPANDALVVVPLEGLLSDPVPPLAVVGLGAALPVRMPLAGERLREPRVLALGAAEDVITIGNASTTSERGATFPAFEFLLTTGPARVPTTRDIPVMSPRLGFDTRFAVVSRLFGGIILERRITDITLRRLLPTPIVRVVLALERHRRAQALLGTVLLPVLAVEFRFTPRTFPVRQSFSVCRIMMDSQSMTCLETQLAIRTVVHGDTFTRGTR